MSRIAKLMVGLVVLVVAVGCDSGETPKSESTPTAAIVQNPAPATQSPTASTQASTPATDTTSIAVPPTPDDSAASPTAVTSTGTGREITALQALRVLIPKATAWQADAQLGLLANVRPGQEKNLLGDALGKPDINEPTPGGLGRDWTLVAFSPSVRGAMAFAVAGAQADLVKEGAVSNETLDLFFETDTNAPTLAQLDMSKLVDSDRIAAMAGERGKEEGAGIALLTPDNLGVGPLPAPSAGGPSPHLAYEIFTQEGGFIFFDAESGAVVLDGGT
jgi:hypothetical protein